MISSIRWVCILVIALGLFLMLPFSTISADDTSPVTHNGKKWKLGFYEGGPYTNYPLHLRELVNGLGQLGWVEKTDIPKLEKIALELMPHYKIEDLNLNNSTLIWEWLAKNIKSEYIQFSKSACWSANWNGDQRKINRKEAIELLKKGDIDLIIAMGTWAGQDLVNNEHSVPTVVMSTSDPVRAGIIKSPMDSGYAHVHAMCDPSRYLRQVRLFHSIINFEKLGVVYENTIEGRSYASIQDIEQVARERNFKIIYCEAPFSGVDEKKATEAIIECHTELAKKVDALYITVHRGVAIDSMNDIMVPLIIHKIPTFSQRGILEVEYGALYCLDRESFSNLGQYYAKSITKILKGTRPGDLDQVYEEPKKIAINLDTAKKIDYKPPPNILNVADIIYAKTEGAK